MLRIHRPWPLVRRGCLPCSIGRCSRGSRLFHGTWAETNRPMNCIKILTRLWAELGASTTSPEPSRVPATIRTLSPISNRRQSPPLLFICSTRCASSLITSLGTAGATPSKFTHPDTWGKPWKDGLPSPSKSHFRNIYPGKSGTNWGRFSGWWDFMRGENISNPALKSSAAAKKSAWGVARMIYHLAFCVAELIRLLSSISAFTHAAVAEPALS